MYIARSAVLCLIVVDCQLYCHLCLRLKLWEMQALQCNGKLGKVRLVEVQVRRLGIF